MAANRFMRMFRKRHLVSFEIQEHNNGNFEKMSVVISQDLETWLKKMQHISRRFHIIFIKKL